MVESSSARSRRNPRRRWWGFAGVGIASVVLGAAVGAVVTNDDVDQARADAKITKSQQELESFAAKGETEPAESAAPNSVDEPEPTPEPEPEPTPEPEPVPEAEPEPDPEPEEEPAAEPPSDDQPGNDSSRTPNTETDTEAEDYADTEVEYEDYEYDEPDEFDAEWALMGAEYVIEDFRLIDDRIAHSSWSSASTNLSMLADSYARILDAGYPPEVDEADYDARLSTLQEFASMASAEIVDYPMDGAARYEVLRSETQPLLDDLNAATGSDLRLP